MNIVNAKNFIRNVRTDDTGIVQLSKRDNWEGTAPDWEIRTPVTFLVMRRERDVKVRGRVYPKGELIALGIKEIDWAEHGEDAWDESFATFTSENYRMHILEWNGLEIDDAY